MPTLEEIQDETVRATNEKDDDDWNDEDSDAIVSGSACGPLSVRPADLFFLSPTFLFY